MMDKVMFRVTFVGGRKMMILARKETEAVRNLRAEHGICTSVEAIDKVEGKMQG